MELLHGVVPISKSLKASYPLTNFSQIRGVTSGFALTPLKRFYIDYHVPSTNYDVCGYVGWNTQNRRKPLSIIANIIVSVVCIHFNY